MHNVKPVPWLSLRALDAMSYLKKPEKVAPWSSLPAALSGNGSCFSAAPTSTTNSYMIEQHSPAGEYDQTECRCEHHCGFTRAVMISPLKATGNEPAQNTAPPQPRRRRIPPKDLRMRCPRCILEC